MTRAETRRVCLLPVSGPPAVHELPWGCSVKKRGEFHNHASRLLGLGEDELFWRENQTVWSGTVRGRNVSVKAMFRDKAPLGAPNQHLPFIRGPVCVVGVWESDDGERFGYDDYDKHLAHETVLEAVGLRQRLHNVDNATWRHVACNTGQEAGDMVYVDKRDCAQALAGFDTDGYLAARQAVLAAVGALACKL